MGEGTVPQGPVSDGPGNDSPGNGGPGNGGQGTGRGVTDDLGRALARASAMLLPVERAMSFAGGLIVFALMFLGVIQIVLRTVFRAPMFGYIDIVELTMIGFAILGISYVQHTGNHVRMEIVVARLKGRALWIFEFLGAAVIAFIVAVLIPYSYNHFLRAWNFGDSTIDIELATWPAKLVVPVALAVLLARLVIQCLGYLRLAVDPGLEPVAVPFIKTVEQLAEEEIEATH